MGRSSRSSRRLSPLEQRLTDLPAEVLTRLGLARCIGCDFASFETVEEAARELGLEPRRVARALAPGPSRKGKR